ncbi:MAG: hypothetical protein PHE16_12070 [Aliarcobacter sp.]|nr:hypothetical protein [Aliarcobacter sp.]
MIATTETGMKVKLNENGTWQKVVETTEIDNNNYNVRKTYWGMSYLDVLNSETIELDKSNNDILFGTTTLNGLEALIAFDFINNELYDVRYVFINEHAIKSNFISDFENLRTNLNKKYGKEFENHRFFTDDLYDDVPSEWDMALGRGTLSYFTIWKTPDTEISLSLYGDNHEIKFNITYMSLKHKELVQKTREKSLLDEL